MNTLLIIIAIIGGIIALLLIAALFIPKQYSVSVSEIINRPKREVYRYVSLFQNQTQYSEWLKPDPELKPEFVGIDGTVGSVMKWESHHPNKNNNIGKGEQEIISMDADNIEVELRLIKPMAGTCKIVHHLAESGGEKTVYTCSFYAYAKFPLNFPSYLLGRSFIKKTQGKTLRNIKEILEKSES